MMRIRMVSYSSIEDRKSARRTERGQLLPLTALAVILAGLAVIGLARLGHAASLRAQAQTSADAAALAGAASGRQAAVSVAQANGASILEYREMQGSVSVQVKLGQARAKAKAEADTS